MRVAAASSVLLLAACGGGGGGSGPSNTLIAPLPQQPATGGGSGGAGTLGIAITVPSGSSASAARTPRYISPSTASLTVTLQGAQTPLATVNLTPGSPNCSPVPLGTLCTASIGAPLGTNTYVVTTYSAANAGGQQLGTATLQQTIQQNYANTLALIINGVVASATAILGTTSVGVGTATSVSVTVVAYDAAGNVIVGPGNYSTPIALTDSDTSGMTSLSPSSVAAPGVAVKLNYNGGSLLSATITPMVGSTPGTPATLTPTGYAVANYNLPSSDTWYQNGNALVTGPDGNLWYGTNGIIGKVSPSGQFTEYGSANGVPAGQFIQTLATGSDHNVWFGTDTYPYSSGPGQLGAITPSGTVTLVQPACGYTVGYMVSGPDGNLWFTDPECEHPQLGQINPATMTVQEWDLTYINPGAFCCGVTGQIAFGPDGNLYMADYFGYIDRVAFSGGAPSTLTQVPLLSGCGAQALAAGPDGNIWFSDECANVGLVSPADFSQGGMGEWSVAGEINPLYGNYIYWFASTADSIWGTDDFSDSIYRFTGLAGVSGDTSQGAILARVRKPAGVSTTPSPGTSAQSTPPVVIPVQAFSSAQYNGRANDWADPWAIALGPDGNIWTTSDYAAPFAMAKVVFGSPGTGVQGAARSLEPMSRIRRTGNARHRIAQGAGARHT